jgi:fatty-acid peroxygenase
VASIPHNGIFDSSRAFRNDPYRFIARTCQRLDSDVFRTRLLLRPTICMTGAENARLFYDPSRFKRAGAAPEPLTKTLLGVGSVMSLDGRAHQHRKEMLMSLFSGARIDLLARAFRKNVMAAASRWSAQPRVVLFDELREVLTRSVCTWAGVPLAPDELEGRVADLSSLFDEAAAVSWRHVRSRLARRRAQRWAAAAIQDVRNGNLRADDDTALHRIATYRTLDGELLSPRIAAVELLNVLRPTVAVSVFMVFAVHALHMHQRLRPLLGRGDQRLTRAVVQEVRRFYPFFPATVAKVRKTFHADGMRYATGTRVLLDLHGINHDPRLWHAPDEFRPERFLGWSDNPFTFVPQGGGGYDSGHRCAGERLTIALMQAAVDFFANEIDYDVPDQDLAIDWRRLPALPKSGMVLSNIRICAAQGAISLAARRTSSTSDLRLRP